MGKFRNITDDALYVPAVGRVVKPDEVVDLDDDSAQATVESGHPAPVWAKALATSKKSAPAADKE